MVEAGMGKITLSLVAFHLFFLKVCHTRLFFFFWVGGGAFVVFAQLLLNQLHVGGDL